MALASVRRIADDGCFHLDLTKSQAFRNPNVGEICFLDRRYTDFNSGRLIGDLARLDAEPDPWFVRLLDDPLRARGRPTVINDIRDTAIDLGRRHGMTASQLDAFAGSIEHDLQLVWGPPGTGKTHFLALAVLCMAEAHRRAGQPLRVLISAFTHSAIDNCLRKLGDLQADHRVFNGDVPIRKALKRGSAPAGLAPLIHPDHLAARLRQEPINVTGSTVWQLFKTDPADFAFDYVVIDEGSQLKVAEAAVPIRRLRPGGRLIIAGDDKQLAPIVQGNYPTETGEPLLHRSILECLRERDGEERLTTTLLENFRMCDVLCDYPRSSIYPADYRPFSRQVAERRLPKAPAACSDITRLLVGPEYPLVVCALEGVQATAENLVEARLVADATMAIHQMFDEPDDEEFWRDRLFIVSPHHAQIRQIRKELQRRRDWTRTFVDTVDATQGQECDAVLVSYGVSDVEYALNEKEFIYSLNRLNVSVTRARAKTVVFLSRQLLEPPIQALDQDDVADGIAFMQGLARFCETRTPTVRIPITTSVAARVYRAS
jgi:hypothetical protein